MNDMLMIVGFVLFLFVLCIIWNKIMMFQYEKKLRCQTKLSFEIDIQSVDLTLVANKPDGNTDNKFSDAVQKIELPQDVRIEIYE